MGPPGACDALTELTLSESGPAFLAMLFDPFESSEKQNVIFEHSAGLGNFRAEANQGGVNATTRTDPTEPTPTITT